MTKVLCATLFCFVAASGLAQESDYETHQELRAMLQQVQAAINSGNYDAMLPFLDEKIAATSVTQEVMSNRGDVSAYFKEWFGPTGYMKSMNMKLEADALTELSPDKSWGLVRGNALEHYDAKDGNQFDFKTRWTALVAKNSDNRWRLRAIHFGTNHLDNPVLWKVERQLIQYGVIASFAMFVIGLGLGWLIWRRPARSLRTDAAART
jgi:ketosteroid isomerase-like protein